MTATVEPAPTASAPTDGEPGGLVRHVQDGLALLLLVAVLLYLEDHDGGFELGALRWVGVVAVLAIPAVVHELARLPRWVAWLMAAWAAGTVVSVGFGQVRAFALDPALTHALAPVVLLAAHRIWRRSWGPAALGGLLLVAAGAYWHRSFLQWWGHTLNGQQPVWLSLSWRNPSGMLMGAFGLVFLGVALATERVHRAAAVLLAAAAFAGVWLSSSRGAVLVVGVTAVLVLGAALLRPGPGGRLRATLVAATVGLLTLAIATVLLAMDDREDAASPLESRSQTVETNTRARLHHAQAALGMFADRPLTGQGLGSYRETALPFTSPDANLTASAHNEYAENLGEGGILLGGTFLVANAAAVLAALRVLRRRRSGDPLREGLQLGAAGLVIAIAAHSALDFDWGYPVLPALLAIGVATLVPRRTTDRRAVGATWTAGLLTACLLIGAVLATSVELAWDRGGTDLTPEEFAAAPSPLDLPTLTSVGYQLWRIGEAELALEVAERGATWHPGATRLATLARIARFELGRMEADELAGSLEAGSSRFDEYQYVAESLVEAGELALARDVLDRQRRELDRHRAWGVTTTAQQTWPVVVRLEAVAGGCSAAQQAAERAIDDELADFPDTATADGLVAAAGVDC